MAIGPLHKFLCTLKSLRSASSPSIYVPGIHCVVGLFSSFWGQTSECCHHGPLTLRKDPTCPSCDTSFTDNLENLGGKHTVSKNLITIIPVCFVVLFRCLDHSFKWYIHIFHKSSCSQKFKWFLDNFLSCVFHEGVLWGHDLTNQNVV